MSGGWPAYTCYGPMCPFHCPSKEMLAIPPCRCRSKARGPWEQPDQLLCAPGLYVPLQLHSPGWSPELRLPP